MEGEPTNGTGRRQFLRSAGAMGGLSLFPGLTAADPVNTAEEAGISLALRKLTDRGKFEQAATLCEQHGVKYGYSSSPMPSFGTLEAAVSGDGDVSIQDAFKKGDSWLSFYYWFERTDPEGQEIYAVESYVSIAEDDANVIDDANPYDGLSIYWSDTYFQAVSESQSNYEAVGADSDLQSYQDYHSHGVWAKFDDNYVQDHSVALDGNVEHFYCGIRTEIEKLQYGNSFNVNAEYLHNWNPGGLYYVSSFNLGPVGINFGGTNVYDWRHEETEKI